MRYEENVKIKRCVNKQKEVFGFIELQHVADPQSVAVSFCGKRIYPKEFNIFGEPIFTKEVCDLFDWKERELKEEHKRDVQLTALVTYESSDIKIDSKEINSDIGIEKNIQDLKSLNQLIKNRKIYKRLSKDNILDDYVIFGMYLLDKDGLVQTLSEQSEESKVQEQLRNYVCHINDFIDGYRIHKSNKKISWELKDDIPEEGERCPWCTKELTYKDIKMGVRIGTINGKRAHQECARQYEQATREYDGWHNEEPIKRYCF